MSVVAIIGRPNVGKSTIFNKLTSSKSAIVADYSGLTRDRKYGNLKESHITLIDTGGLNDDSDDMSHAIKEQTDLAIQESDLLLFVVDAIDGILPLDKEIAQSLRKQNKEIVLLINKTDNSMLEESSAEFNSLATQVQEEIFLSYFPDGNQLNRQNQQNTQNDTEFFNTFKNNAYKLYPFERSASFTYNLANTGWIWADENNTPLYNIGEIISTYNTTNPQYDSITQLVSKSDYTKITQSKLTAPTNQYPLCYTTQTTTVVSPLTAVSYTHLTLPTKRIV